MLTSSTPCLDKLSAFANDFTRQSEGICPECGEFFIEGECACDFNENLLNLEPVPAPRDEGLAPREGGSYV